LLQAGITGEFDSLAGVAENIIVGQPVTLGTGAVNLVYRAPKITNEAEAEGKEEIVEEIVEDEVKGKTKGKAKAKA
jgi:hypothetical protein